MKIKTLVFFGLLPFLLGLVACNPDKIVEKAKTYDQTSFLENIGGQLILPALQQLQSESEALVDASQLFEQGPTEENLLALRAKLKDTRMAWQWVQPFAFGPMSAQNLQAVMGVYPVDIQQIERNIAEGGYNFESVSNLDAIGFQAIGYLLYGEPGTNLAGLLDQLADAQRRRYITDIAEHLSNRVQQATQLWKADYIDNGAFASLESQGTDAGSSTATLVNAVNLNFERNLRDGKLAIPLGVRSLGTSIPEATEAYFAGYSVELFQESIKAYLYLYEGIGADGVNREGFYEYLSSIQAVDTGGENLADIIRSQISLIATLSEHLSDPFTEEIENNKQALENLFVDMQRLVVYFKTDMASSMGVVIVYQDNDGD